MQEFTSQGRPPSIYKLPQRTSRWPLSLGWNRGHRTLPSDHRTLDPQRPVLRGWPRVLLKSRASVSNGYLQNTGRSVGPHRMRPVHTRPVRREFCKLTGSPDVSHRTVRCSPYPCAERVTKTPAHRTLSTGLTLVCPVHSAKPDSTTDAKGQRLVPPRSASGDCFSVRNTLVTSPKFPSAQ